MRLQIFQPSENQRAVRPRAGMRDIQVITAGSRSEALRTLRCTRPWCNHPVAKPCVLADEFTVTGLSVIPVRVPLAVFQQSHLTPLERFFIPYCTSGNRHAIASATSELRQQRERFAYGHQQRDHPGGCAECGKNPRQHSLYVHQQIAGFGGDQCQNVREIIMRLVLAGAVGDVLADTRILIAGSEIVETRQQFL